MDKLEVGMKVYLKSVGNVARDSKEIKEVVIKKIGRKYFEVGDEESERIYAKFNLEDLREVTDYGADWKLYFSKQEILDEEEYEKLRWEIKTKFDTFGKLGLTLEQLRKVKAIIDSE